jgi:rhamnogalacturonan endolyase
MKGLKLLGACALLAGFFVTTSPRAARAAQRSHSSVSSADDTPRLVSFGLENAGSTLVVNTGAKTVFTVSSKDGDLLSVKYDGIEITAPGNETHRYSHYEEGLGGASTSVTSKRDEANGLIEITVTNPSLGVTQYYIAKKGDDAIYMATYAGNAKAPAPGEMRFITYLNKEVFTKPPIYSDITGSTEIEGKDVFRNTETGETHSKFYGGTQFIDDHYHGVTAARVGAFMVIGSQECASGGPFFKDIDFQTESKAIEMYNYMYSGHLQTEAFRPGLHGPYALQFTRGDAPEPLDFSFLDNLNLQGQVPASARGSLSGTASGVPAKFRATVGLANSTAQYWARADPSTGQYLIEAAKPGNYTETLYQDELAVATQSVTIAAGNPTTANIRSTLYAVHALWTIGTWDGTPLGFRNADKIATMHPSDRRMAPWTDVVFVVGTTPQSSWPMTQWKDVNNHNQIEFSLTASEARMPLTLRIGITLAQFGGRPQITVNKGQPHAWESKLPAVSRQPESRGITRGTWRGNETVFPFEIPTSALRPGKNSIIITVNSGSGNSKNAEFLSPAITYDAIDLIPTRSLTNTELSESR